MSDIEFPAPNVPPLTAEEWELSTPGPEPPDQLRPASGRTWDADAVSPGGGEKSAGASRVPYVSRDAGTGRTYASPVVTVEEPQLEAQDADAFAAVDEPSAEPLIGDDENTVLAAGGSATYYGDGGAGKTTLGLDQACHLCAGLDWLGLPVPYPVTVLWIENEGPRGVRRECLDRLLIFGRRQLEHVLRVYIRHFNQQRPHRALDLRPPDRGSGTDPVPTKTLYPLQVSRRDLLGGLLHEYEAAA